MLSPALEHLALEQELARRELVAGWLATLFPKQRAFVADPARFKAAHPGRRGGKTVADLLWLLEGASDTPGAVCPYIAPTGKQARRIAWGELKRIDLRLGLGLKFRETDCYAYLPNGSAIWLSGCADVTEIEKYRGEKYRRVVIDEGGSFPGYLEDLIEQAIEPALVDQHGELAITGTPAITKQGYFWEVCSGEGRPGWPTHHWDMRDNPHIRHAAQEIEDVIKRRGWTWEHPTLQREWLGRWVADASMLVYRFTAANLIGALPVELTGWRYILGVDLGTSKDKPSTAFAVIAYHALSRVAFAVHTESHAAMTPSTIADRVAALNQAYRFEAIVMDQGGLGGGYISEMQQRYRLPVEPAEKNNKRGYIELLNGDLQSGQLMLVRSGCAGLIAEWQVLPWKNDLRLDERDGVPNHHADATLYAWRRARAFDGRDPPAEPPKIGTDEYARQQVELIRKAQFTKPQQRGRWGRR